jgi:hypothetical protein
MRSISRIASVAVPTLDHLAVLGKPSPLPDFLQRATGAQVLVMDPQPDLSTESGYP